MKILFDTQDVTDKFAQLLANEGIQAADIIWGGEEGAPTVEVILDEDPDVTVKPLRVEIEELKTRVADLEEQLEQSIHMDAPLVIQTQPKPRRGRKPKIVEAPQARKEEVVDGAALVAEAMAMAKTAAPESERVRKIKQQMKDEENLWGNPLGSEFKQGARPLGPNESYTPPKD